jgi:hypothetical protein
MITAILALFALQVAAADLSLAVSCGARQNQIRVAMQNNGNADTAVVLGTTLGAGGLYVPYNLTFEITRPRGGTEKLIYHPLWLPAVIAGRLDPWLLPLPRQSTFTLTLPAMDFFSGKDRYQPQRGDELRVTFMGNRVDDDPNGGMPDLRLWRVWTGTAKSNVLRLGDCSSK